MTQADDPEYLTDLVASKCQDPRVGIWIGLEGGEPKALITARLPIDPRSEQPVFDLATNFGSQTLADELLQAAWHFTLSAGYNRANALNMTGKPDAVYIRRARQLGLKARVKCSLIELEKEEPSNGHEFR